MTLKERLLPEIELKLIELHKLSPAIAGSIEESLARVSFVTDITLGEAFDINYYLLNDLLNAQGIFDIFIDEPVFTSKL